MERNLRRFSSKMFTKMKSERKSWDMKKERESERMKKFIKKIAIAVLAGTITFSIVPATVQAAGWKQNKNGYWWQENDYSYPKNQWKTIYGKQYHFNSKGYMDTDWTKVDGKWYYFGGKNDGAKKTYWQKVRGKYYWLGRDGVMRTGWQNVYGKYYWLGGSNDGAMKTGWQKVGGKYYLLGKNGDMKSGWQTVYGKKYYLGGANDGAMKTGWQKISGSDYYFGRTGESNEGVLRTNTYIGDYYVNGSGKWNGKRDLKAYLDNESKVSSIVYGDNQNKIVGFGRDKDQEKKYVEYLIIVGNSKYSVYGVYFGQSVKDAETTLSNQGWELNKTIQHNGGTVYSFRTKGMQIDVEKNSRYGDRVTFSRVYYDSNGNVIGGIRYNQDDESKPVVQSAVPAESEEDTENIQSVEEQISEEQSPEKQEELTQEFVGEEENSEIQEEDSQAEGNESEDGQESESTEENELN